MRNAMNEVTRIGYIADCEKGLARWNRIIARAGRSTRLVVPSPRFRRTIGSWANVPTDPAGNPIAQDVYDRNVASWLPTANDREFVASLMHRVTEPGKVASWIAPPDKGIKELPFEYEYVRFA